MFMEWIRVEDRLPIQGQRVLCYAGTIYEKVFEKDIFYDGETDYYCPIGEITGVTHWAPLPTSPSEDKSILDITQEEWNELVKKHGVTKDFKFNKIKR